MRNKLAARFELRKRIPAEWTSGKWWSVETDEDGLVFFVSREAARNWLKDKGYVRLPHLEMVPDEVEIYEHE